MPRGDKADLGVAAQRKALILAQVRVFHAPEFRAAGVYLDIYNPRSSVRL